MNKEQTRLIVDEIAIAPTELRVRCDVVVCKTCELFYKIGKISIHYDKFILEIESVQD
jgi:hypothetical protein